MPDDAYEILIDAELGNVVAGVTAIGDFALQAGDALGAVYPEQGGLQVLHEDLLLGRPFPMTLAMRSISCVGTLVSIALFTHRELALHPRMGQLVRSASLVDRLKIAGRAHISPDLLGFFRLMEGYLPTRLKRDEQQARLRTVVDWICEYVEDERLPALPQPPSAPEILEHGTGGFVAAEAAKGSSLEDAWISLFRQGFLWGVVFKAAREGRRTALVGRKSVWAPLAPSTVAERLNEVESAMQELPEWAADELWVRSPQRGTLLPVESVVQVVIVR